MDEQIRTLDARIRQLLPQEENALKIYTDLADKCTDQETSEQLRQIARDEVRHIALEKEILSLLGS